MDRRAAAYEYNPSSPIGDHGQSSGSPPLPEGRPAAPRRPARRRRRPGHPGRRPTGLPAPARSRSRRWSDQKKRGRGRPRYLQARPVAPDAPWTGGLSRLAGDTALRGPAVGGGRADGAGHGQHRGATLRHRDNRARKGQVGDRFGPARVRAIGGPRNRRRRRLGGDAERCGAVLNGAGRDRRGPGHGDRRGVLSRRLVGADRGRVRLGAEGDDNIAVPQPGQFAGGGEGQPGLGEGRFGVPATFQVDAAGQGPGDQRQQEPQRQAERAQRAPPTKSLLRYVLAFRPPVRSSPMPFGRWPERIAPGWSGHAPVLCTGRASPGRRAGLTGRSTRAGSDRRRSWGEHQRRAVSGADSAGGSTHLPWALMRAIRRSSASSMGIFFSTHSLPT